MVSEQQRQLVLVNAAYRHRQWRLTSTGSVIELFELLKNDAVAECDRHSISWFRGKSIGHLENKHNVAGSALLAALRLEAVGCFVQVTVCSDLVLMVDQQVIASDGAIFSRNECRAVNLKRFPTPAQIKERCLEIRRNKPRTDYMDEWTGCDSAAIREINLKEVMGCSF